MTKLLKNLTADELKALYQKNQEFADAVWSNALDTNLFWQGEWFDEMLGKNNRGYSYNNHYTSFYLRVTDAERFVADLPDTCRDYLPADKTELFDRAKTLLKEWQEFDYDEQDRNEGHFTKLEVMATDLLGAIEETLHEFETVSDDDIDEQLNEIIDGGGNMAEWELGDNGHTITEYLTKCYN